MYWRRGLAGWRAGCCGAKAGKAIATTTVAIKVLRIDFSFFDGPSVLTVGPGQCVAAIIVPV